MNLNLKGKFALIGGGSAGIGFAAAQELSLLGATCILMARHKEKLQEALSKLDRSFGQSHEFIVVDYSNGDELINTLKNLNSFKEISIWVNNTGGPPSSKITDAAPKDFDFWFKTHLVTSQCIAQALLPNMQQLNFGRIINVISTSVKIPIDGLGISNTIRGAVASWAKTWSNEVAKFGITVNNVLPGNILTDRHSSLVAENSLKNNHTPKEIEAMMLQKIPAARFGLPEEMGSVIAFLASPAAAYINGESIRVDGGKTGSI